MLGFLYIIIFGVILPVFIIKILGYAYPYFFWGAIYVPTSEEKVKKMVKILEVKPGQRIVDLRAGDGRLLIALAKEGAQAHGYEINPFLVLRAMKNIRKAGLGDKAFIHWKSMWSQDINDFDAVVVFPMKHIMKKLENKFEKELKPGVKIVSNFFTLPTWKPDSVEEDIYLYTKR